MAILAGGFHTVNPLHLTETGISVSEPAAYIMYFTIVGLFVILSFTVGKRAFCHYVCWVAPFMVIGAKIKNYFKWPSLHLESTGNKCKQCKICDKNCPQGVIKYLWKHGKLASTQRMVAEPVVQTTERSRR